MDTAELVSVLCAWTRAGSSRIAAAIGVDDIIIRTTDATIRRTMI
jgi:hypothetical protein